jgi:hypothetical protein
MQKRWPFLAVLLALGLALGMTLSAVQASDMAVEMAMGDSGHDDCDGCGGNGNDLSCLALCTAHAPAVLASAMAVPAPASFVNFHFDDLSLDGRSFRPDPGPPRTGDIA